MAQDRRPTPARSAGTYRPQQSAASARSLWDWLNRPLVQLPRATRPAVLPGPERGALTPPVATREALPLVNAAGDVVTSATSPATLATLIASGGASTAGRAGLFGISRAARAFEAGLSAPAILQGLARAGTPESVSPGTRLSGVAQAILGGLGTRAAATHAFDPNAVARTYMRETGRTAARPQLLQQIDEPSAKAVADAYEALAHTPTDPATAAAYRALGQEVQDQYRFITQRAGVRVEPWQGAGEPYPNSAAMVEDVQRNNHLWYLPTQTAHGPGRPGTALETLENPMLAAATSGRLVNDEFRAVHDYFGHRPTGRPAGFGPVGEENAARLHEIMFSPRARPALVTETRGQNSWVNFGPHLRRPDGSLPRVGDPDWIPLAQRPFAEQKIGLLPRVTRD